MELNVPVLAAPMRFRPEQHLSRQADIRAVREHGRRVECHAFTLWWKHRETASVSLQSPLTSPSFAAPLVPAPAAAASRRAPITGARVCVIASTAAVGGAVLRNRAKRRLRELFRHRHALVPPSCDLLLIARLATTQWPMAELEKKFAEGCAQITPPPSAPPA
jgi:ribonuclease P protein component